MMRLYKCVLSATVACLFRFRDTVTRTEQGRHSLDMQRRLLAASSGRRSEPAALDAVCLIGKTLLLTLTYPEQSIEPVPSGELPLKTNLNRKNALASSETEPDNSSVKVRLPRYGRAKSFLRKTGLDIAVRTLNLARDDLESASRPAFFMAG
ncbi:MAG: hypothetical protein HY887_03735 [Deltaproteobacteria bacterium]|nr:hypothetical protein [Deltaproteobacteria bacterium]